MKLLNGVSPETADNSLQQIKNIEKRLQLLYPGKHELKKYIEQEIYVVLLKIDLNNKPGITPVHSKLVNGHELKKDYAYN